VPAPPVVDGLDALLVGLVSQPMVTTVMARAKTTARNLRIGTSFVEEREQNTNVNVTRGDQPGALLVAPVDGFAPPVEGGGKDGTGGGAVPPVDGEPVETGATGGTVLLVGDGLGPLALLVGLVSQPVTATAAPKNRQRSNFFTGVPPLSVQVPRLPYTPDPRSPAAAYMKRCAAVLIIPKNLPRQWFGQFFSISFGPDAPS
jgi:hypothetical protein